MPPLDDIVGGLGKAFGGAGDAEPSDPVGSLLGVLGGEAGKVSPDVASAVLGMLGAPGAKGPAAATATAGGGGGLDGLVDTLKQAGLGEAVGSWISTGPNLPVDPERLGAALGPERVQQLSGASGVSPGQLLPQLSAFLPELVNALTPNGKLPDPQQLAQSGLGGFLGGLLKGGGGGR